MAEAAAGVPVVVRAPGMCYDETACNQVPPPSEPRPHWSPALSLGPFGAVENGYWEHSNFTLSLAAFLVAAGKYSVFGYSDGWFDEQWHWHAIYNRQFGEPLGLAI